MIKLKRNSPTDCYVEIDGNRVGPTMNEKEIEVVVKWLNLSQAEIEVEAENNEETS